MLVGLTGNFGSGKSAVLSEFDAIGAVTVSADGIVHRLLKSDKIKGMLVAVTGDIIIHDGEQKGEIDKRKMADIVFSDSEIRAKVEAIIHPQVIKEIKALAELNRTTSVVAEIPLLFEGGFDKLMDKTVTVTGTRGVVIERLLKKGYSQEEIDRRLAAQMPDSEKVRMSDYVIDNSSTLEDTRRQVKVIYEKLAA
ncbi:MAG: dephospho-CoA kinase [Nitrospirae bacterium]|nr:dephospho-CoA kinase [Nitrospirota bacterium]